MYKRYGPRDYVALEKAIEKEAAIKLGMVPLSTPIYAKCEWWILANMIEDCVALKINYCLVKERNGRLPGISIYKATHRKHA